MVPFPFGPLIRWYLKHRRRLPWRDNPTPYKVWVSEIMLQQTQVKNVLPYYRKFMRRFPNFKTLSKSKESEVLSHWSGLGYYARARNLHKTAKIVSQKFSGQFPSNFRELIRLPGIGPYSAGAILSIAYNLPQPILDGNVRRVLSRFYLIRPQSELWKISKKFVLEVKSAGLLPSDFNQSLMELGALVCLPRNPLCNRCPVRSYCRARTNGLQSFYPQRLKKTRTIHKHFALAILHETSMSNSQQNHFFIRIRSDKQKWLKNLWEFPMVELADKNGMESRDFLKRLSKQFSKNVEGAVKIKTYLGQFNHAITHHRLKVLVFEGVVRGVKSSTYRRTCWLNEPDLKKLPSSSILRKALALVF